MLIPFAMFLFLKITEICTPGRTRWMALLLVFSMIFPLRGVLREEPLAMPRFAREVTAYLRDHVRTDDKIILDHCGDEKFREPIKLLSGVNLDQFVVAPYTDIVTGKGMLVNKSKFIKVLDEYNITMLVYSPRGGLGPILALEKDRRDQVIGGFNFRLVFFSKPYYIYRITRTEGKDE
jgi:hypothetical protein